LRELPKLLETISEGLPHFGTDPQYRPVPVGLGVADYYAIGLMTDLHTVIALGGV
jgi:hypothetical protein